MNAPIVDPLSSSEAFRNSLVDSTVRQLFGPLPGDFEEEQNEILTISPLQLYATGVLFPQKMSQQNLEDSTDPTTVDEKETLEETSEQSNVDEGRPRGGAGEGGNGSEEREPLNLANEFSPSAAGISFSLANPADLKFTVSCGTYEARSVVEAHPRAGETGLDGRSFPLTRTSSAWKRLPFLKSINLHVGDEIGVSKPVPLDANGALSLRITTRRRSDGRIVVSAGVGLGPGARDAAGRSYAWRRSRAGADLNRSLGGAQLVAQQSRRRAS